MKLQEGHRLEKNFIWAPLDDILTPKPGRICFGPAYWLVNDQNEVSFCMFYSNAQCGMNEQQVNHAAQTDFKNRHVLFVPMAFLPHECQETMVEGVKGSP